ncbi:Short-chain dehydrogenase [Planctomycetales bacterium 10988]|nr:Short-chain dehydrogenase [Planctomycetales bacterium 10988]
MTEEMKNRWALVTGASRGIGRDFATLFAERGAKVVLVARSQESLDSLKEDLKTKHQCEAIVISCNLGRPDGIEELLQVLNEHEVQIDYLVNNAGFGSYGSFLQQSREKQLQMIDLNIRSLTHLTWSLAEKMKQRGFGHIVQLGSILSFLPMPDYAVYSASKQYVLSFSQGIREELKPHGVFVTTLCPGPTATSFFDHAGQDISNRGPYMMTSQEVAEIGMKAMLAKKALVVPGWKNKLFIFLCQWLPQTWFSNLISNQMEPIKEKDRPAP